MSGALKQRCRSSPTSTSPTSRRCSPPRRRRSCRCDGRPRLQAHAQARRDHHGRQRPLGNGGLKLQVAVSYGGRWDIIQATQKLAKECSSGALRPEDISEAHFAAQLALAGVPPADLLIRTGGEYRVSNFLLWDIAYAELYFSARLWPDFAVADLEEALAFFASRERRFGHTVARASAAKA